MIFPCQPNGKIPAIKGWQEKATYDPGVIEDWFAERPNLNYGIVTGPVSNIVVIDLDGPEAQAWWAEQGIPSGAIVTTPSGPDRTHHYYWTDEQDIQTNKKKLHPNVDVRAWGGLAVGPGSVIDGVAYSGDLSNIPNVPQKLLDLLPRRSTAALSLVEDAAAVPAPLHVGTPVEAASESERRQITKIIRTLDALPRVWHEGAGWRSTMYQMGCWLSRMVNSAAYAMTEDMALGILIAHTPTDHTWGGAEIVEQWNSAVTSTRGTYAEAPEESYPEFLPFLTVANLLPETTSKGASWNHLLYEEPEIKTDAHFSALRQELVREALLAGLDDQTAASLAWGSRAGLALQKAPSGLRSLWGEVATAKKKTATQQLAAADPSTAPKLVTDKPTVISLLSAAENAYLGGEAGQWIGTRYMDWAATRVKAMNAPYHRMNRWTWLSLVLSPFGSIPLGEGEMGCNLFSMVLGGTTTGKSASMKLLKACIRASFPDDSPNIGGDASPNSLVEKLIERDSKPSWFNADEAHGLFAEMQGVTWRSGLREKWTMLYEGEVPIILRNGKKDISGIDATTFFVMHLMGTFEGMSKVLDAEFWTSGFLARFVWAIGDTVERTPETMKLNFRRGEKAGEADLMPQQFAAELNKAKGRLRPDAAYSGMGFGDVEQVKPKSLDMTEEAEARHNKFVVDMNKLIDGHRHFDRLAPSSIRFSLNILKCAALVAMSEGRMMITLRDELIAIEQAGEWLTNMFIMVNATDETSLTRDVNRMEQIISKQTGQKMTLTKLYVESPRKSNKRGTDELLDQLVAEGRIDKEQTFDGTWMVGLKVAA